MKEIIYYASSHNDIDIRTFPKKAKQRIARLLNMLAEGLKLHPKDFKYIPSVGMDVYELRIRADRQYRVFNVANI